MGRRETGRGGGRGRRGAPGRMGGPKAAGPGGDCVCPECGERVEHIIGQPCFKTKCPQCGTLMVRE